MTLIAVVHQGAVHAHGAGFRACLVLEGVLAPTLTSLIAGICTESIEMC